MGLGGLPLYWVVRLKIQNALTDRRKIQYLAMLFPYGFGLVLLNVVLVKDLSVTAFFMSFLCGFILLLLMGHALWKSFGASS